MFCVYKYNGIPLKKYCEEINLSYNSVYRHLANGMDIKSAINTAIKNKGNKIRSKIKINGVGLVEYLEKNYKKPVSAFLAVQKMRSLKYTMEEILLYIEKYK